MMNSTDTGFLGITRHPRVTHRHRNTSHAGRWLVLGALAAMVFAGYLL